MSPRICPALEPSGKADMTSELYPGEIVLEDIDVPSFTAPGEFGRGRESTANYGAVADGFPAALLIDPSEFQARIQEKEERKNRLSDLINQAGLPCKNQQQTNFCWFNAPTHCVEIVRLVQNQPMVVLSPGYGAAQITGYRNVGGNGENALQFLIERGTVPVANCPANAISRQYSTPENAELALDYRVTEWTELDPRNVNQLVSLLLRDIPVAIGLNWWSHEVTAVDAVWVNGRVAIRIRNSWGMDWPTQGAGGYAILQGSKMVPDDACAPRVAMAS